MDVGSLCALCDFARDGLPCRSSLFSAPDELVCEAISSLEFGYATQRVATAINIRLVTHKENVLRRFSSAPLREMVWMRVA